ncbi:hypothetical protein BC936DRAFT_144717 [Jimgerdemannia flammicorona]|uniref:GIY-YIG domain-containing protein n=1 Tax=Jimgerdemannia flammicorona TaxID=994334 RepID=A0A433DBU9_9FUNG|nr:hypothetical protein BC936DRAFT_144717 [Jimgerdemannia flammicorona]
MPPGRQGDNGPASRGEIVYVGSSINIANRFYEHLNNKGSNIPLQNAFKKYGISAFNFLVMEDYVFDWTISVKENGL